VLSRIAQSLYWIGRLVERAEDTARLLDVHVLVLLEDTTADEARMCAQVAAALGAPPGVAPATTAGLLDVFAYQDDGPIIGALTTARDNARTIREAISSEIWEALNTTRNSLPAQRARARKSSSHEFFNFVKLRGALVFGLAESTITRDDGWYFLALGRSLERVDMTARILSLARASGDDQLASVALLRACGAFEAYLRSYRAAIVSHHAVEFLLLDRLFPRSVYHALTEAEQCLHRLSPGSGGRTGTDDPGLVALGRARTGLEFADTAGVLGAMSHHLQHVQEACEQASAAIATRFFDQQSFVTWTQEAL
jgi:uncharacterized alpha-E superfamily protein